MATNQNVTQLTQQTGSANTTSLLYAVIGGITDTGLPLSVLFNNPNFTGIPVVPTAAVNTNTTQIASTAYVINQGYLTSTLAASIYLTQANAAATYAVKAGTLAQFSATTSAQLAGVISDETGTGSLVFGTNPTITGATITSSTISGGSGSFTTVRASGSITPSTTAGIVGTTAADNANAGSVGEYFSNSSTGTALTTAIVSNATSVTLTAGDWDVMGTVTFIPAGTTTVSQVACGISVTSATFSTANTGAATGMVAGFTTGQQQVVSTPMYRINVAASTTVYLVSLSTFGTSTMSVSGFIRARRVR